MAIWSATGNCTAKNKKGGIWSVQFQYLVGSDDYYTAEIEMLEADANNFKVGSEYTIGISAY